MKVETDSLREILTVSQCVAMYPVVSEERIIQLVELGELQAMRHNQDGIDTILIDRDEFKKQSVGSVQALQEQLKVLQIKRAKQMEMFEADIISISELRERTSAIDKQMQQVKIELERYGGAINNNNEKTLPIISKPL